MAITWLDFEKVELRVGTVLNVEEFPEAKKPMYKLTIDFGEFGTRKSCAQITHYYKPKELVGTQVICVTNFPPKQVANFLSECLTTGFIEDDGKVVLLRPERKVKNGTLLR